MADTDPTRTAPRHRRRGLVGIGWVAALFAAGVALVLLTGRPASLHRLLLKAASPPRVTTVAPSGTAAAPGTGPDTSEPPATGAGAPAPLVVVGLGDSVPSATTCGCTGYVERLGAELGRATGRTSVVHNDAVGGWTSADVERDLRSGHTRADLSHADLVVIEVGANDLDLARVDDPTCRPAAASGCWADTLTDLRGALSRIIAAVRANDAQPGLRVAVVGYWNVTVDGAVGRSRGADFVAGSDDLTRLVNATIADVARRAAAVYVDAYTPFKGPTGRRDPTGELLDDGDHPNADGHALLADAAYAALARAGAVAAWTPR